MPLVVDTTISGGRQRPARIAELPFSSRPRSGVNVGQEMELVYKGTVKWFNNAKGYSFSGMEDSPDVFAYHSSIQLDGYESLKGGDLVAYDVLQGEKGRP